MSAIIYVLVSILAALGVNTGVTEDSPYWNCHVMGNRVCGPTAPEPPYVAGPVATPGDAAVQVEFVTHTR